MTTPSWCIEKVVVYYSLLTFIICFFWSYFILAIPMHKCLGEHLCMSFTFPIVILNGNCFSSVKIFLVVDDALPVKNSTKIIIITGM